jgi:DNA helicase HerA-like ATPase
MQKLVDIGRTIASDRFPNTIDSFWFSASPDAIINPFDFVAVRHVHDTRSIGIVKELQAVAGADNHSGSIVARVAIMANAGAEQGSFKGVPIEMPVGIGKQVRFATEKEVMLALGIPEMENPVPAGVIEMTSGLRVPVSLDISYLLGPDTAHVNAAGISGNQKTTYLLFLLQSVYQKMVKEKEEDVAIIIFNTKEDELLHIHKKRKVRNGSKKLYDILELEMEPFENVTYFLPRGGDGRPNSAALPDNYRTFSFGLEDVYDRLELMLSGADDYGISSIANHVQEAWPLGRHVRTWTDLLGFRDYPHEVVASKSSLLRFLGHVQRFCKSSMFIDRKVTSTYLGKEIKKVKAGDVFVIDIAMIPTVEEQGFVVGDVMKSIDELYFARQTGRRARPKYVLVFIDEINRFLPRFHAGRMSPVAEQIMKTVMAGRSRGTILFSAQQFKSGVDPLLHESTGMHIIAKLGTSELSNQSYSMLDESTKMSIARLNRGELVMVHPAFRHPVRIVFPKAAYRR